MRSRWTREALRARLRAMAVLSVPTGPTTLRAARMRLSLFTIVSQVDNGTLHADSAKELLDQLAERSGPPHPT